MIVTGIITFSLESAIAKEGIMYNMSVCSKGEHHVIALGMAKGDDTLKVILKIDEVTDEPDSFKGAIAGAVGA